MMKKTKLKLNDDCSGEAGYTLTELLVVLVIIALLTGIVAPRLIGRVGKAKSTTAATQIENLISALELYQLDTGQYPTTEQGLDVLVLAPEGLDAWDGPYMRKGVVPLDPWSNPYLYEITGEQFTIFTLGRDNREGGSGEDEDVKSGN